jgi:hypothetical protein
MDSAHVAMQNEKRFSGSQETKKMIVIETIIRFALLLLTLFSARWL